MRFAQLVVFGITTGVIYGLVGLGWGVIYNMTGVLNVAQGEFVMLGAVVTGFAVAMWDLPLATAGALALAVVLVVALLVEFLAVEVVRERSRTAPVLMTLASVFVLSDLARRIFGSDSFIADPLLTGSPLRLPLGVTVPQRMVPIWILALVLFGAYAWFNRTRRGKLMQAAAEDPRGARLIGISTAWTARGAFLIAGLIGGLAGIFLLTVVPVGFASGLGLGVKGFIALALVGMNRPLGALVGGIGLAVMESLIGGYVSTRWSEVAAYLLLIGMLLVLPSGLASMKIPRLRPLRSSQANA